MDKLIPPGVTEVVHELAGGISGGTDAAYAIMTTDTVPKQASLHHANKWNVGGMAKGAGMLAPALATMLCVVTTDAVATADQLDTALRAATHLSFDRLDVDGATSTNDTVLLLASGASGVTPTQDELNAAVLAVCDDLADQLMADAEGVTKRVKVTVRGAASESDALIAPGPSPATAWSRQRFSVPIPIGVAFSPQWVSLPSSSIPIESVCPSTGVPSASTRRCSGGA